MKISLDFLNALIESKIIKVYEVPEKHNTFEYATQIYNQGIVIETIYLENEIVNDFNEIIGYFGVNFDHNIIVYYLKGS